MYTYINYIQKLLDFFYFQNLADEFITYSANQQILLKENFVNDYQE